MGNRTPTQALQEASAAREHGDLSRARAILDAALATYPATHMAELHALRGMIRSQQQDHTGARADLEQAREWCEATGDMQSLTYAQVLNVLVMIDVDLPTEQARAYRQRALAIFESQATTVLQHPVYRFDFITTLVGLGTLAEMDDAYAEARSWYRQALTRCDQAALPRSHRFRHQIAARLAQLPVSAA
jgi:tetratricopeptide (TPR) repeat protein